ncbi:MAG: CoA-binding protein, partial [Proteobacteria bacterium]|nr:CoA-binding protein [Pseudomonadota bacterium]
MSIDYSESYIKNILNEVKSIAVVGASSKKERDSYKVMQCLIENGY